MDTHSRRLSLVPALLLAGLIQLAACAPARAVTWLTVNGATGGSLTTPGPLVMRCDASASGARVRLIAGQDTNGNGQLDAGEPVLVGFGAPQDGGWTDEAAAAAVVQLTYNLAAHAIGPLIIAAVDDDGSIIAHAYNLDYDHPAQSVAGAVRYEDGTPAAGVTVREQVGETSWTAFTDVAGNYTLYLPAGGHAIQIRNLGGQGGTPAMKWVDLASGAAQTGENFTVERVAGPRIIGAVTAADSGAPAPGVAVSATEIYTTANVFTFADINGNYALRVSAGTWRVTTDVYDLSGAHGNSAPQDIVVGSTDVEVPLELPRLDNRVYGAVTNPSAAAVTTAWVQAKGASASRVAATNGLGRYELWLPADTYDITAHDMSGAYAFPAASVAHVTVPTGGRADLAMAARASTFSGKVVLQGTATGIPRATVGISETVDVGGAIYADDFSGATDAQGNFSIKLPAGKFEAWSNSYIYNASSPGYSSFTFPPNHTGVKFSITPNHSLPALRDANVVPASGGFGGQPFTFAVTYASPNNLFYSDVYVVVDGWPHHMAQTSWGGDPADFVSGQRFGCTLRLSAGDHAVWFGAIDAQWFTARLPAVGTYTVTAGPNGTIAGTATDAQTSAPIAGAHVTVKTTSPYAEINDGYTDAQGHYAVTAPAGAYSVAVFADDYLAQNWSNISVSLGHTTALDFHLDPVSKFSGTITAAPGGAPLAGVQVVATLPSLPMTRSVTTGADGTYVFPELLAGSWTIVAGKDWYTTQTQTGIALAVGERKVVNFALAATGALAGQVRVFGTTTNIAGAQVKAYLGGVLKATATTAANGVYQMTQNLPAGSYTVVASTDGYVSQTKTGITIATGSTSYCNFGLGISGRLTGQVKDRGTTANLAGATVTASLGGVVKATATTLATGIYVVDRDLPAGTYVVTAAKTGYVAQTKAGIAVVAQTTTYVNFSLDPVRLKGQVRQSGTTTNLTGATVTVYDGSTVKATANANATGIYEIGGVAPGTYTVIATKATYVRQTKLNVTVTDSAITYVNFSLAVSGKLRGQVKDKVTNLPLAGVTITARTGGVVVATGATTSPYGVYEIASDLPAGTYTLIASQPGYLNQGKTGIVVTAGATTYLNFALQPQ